MNDKVSALLEWLPQHSVLSKKLEIRQTAWAGRGIFTTETILPNERLIEIPSTHLLNHATITAHILHQGGAPVPLKYQRLLPAIAPPVDMYKLSLRTLEGLSSFQLMAMYLCVEVQRGDSFWKPFLDCLPQMADFALAPITWADVSGLPASTQLQVKKMEARFAGDYDAVRAFKGSIERETFLWAWMCINSRCLYMEVGQPAGSNFTMCPYVDFINHSTRNQCVLEKTVFGVRSGDMTYSAGDEIYLSYGPHLNEFLLCEYGFTMPENPWNDLDVTEALTCRMDPVAKQFLKEAGYAGDYTLTQKEVSFRTEVALAVMVVREDFGDLDKDRRLKCFIEGITDGGVFRVRGRRILGEVLQEVEEDALVRGEEVHLLQTESAVAEAIRRAHAERGEIARAHREE